jgi:hypothetical protein
LTARKIVCVGFNIPGNDYEVLNLESDRSLLDADIILFQPSIPYDYYGVGEDSFQGKLTLGQTGSFRAVEAARHWRAELKTAIESGKTVVVFLSKPVEVFVYTGEKQYSGTGRNRQVTNIVQPFSSYSFLPMTLTRVVPRGGEAIKIAGDLGPLAPYWAEFGPLSPYEVYVEGTFTKVLLTTRTGDMVVGALIRAGHGNLLLLPPIQYDEEAFTVYSDDGEESWSGEAISFGARLGAALVAMDRALRGERERTPAPSWTQGSEYRLPREAVLHAEIRDISAQVEQLQAARDSVTAELEKEGSLRRLLFETGEELEEAVVDALRTIGFQAQRYKEGESEFDVVFVSPEGRFLGEVEGKDTKAINIDKLSQLERNVQEDFAREEVTEPAKGVLFGNAFRLGAPSERSAAFFTEKCLLGARRSGIALVRTPDLFPVVRYLRETADPSFAAACRQAIYSARGEIVTFAAIPAASEDRPEESTGLARDA